MTAQIDGLSLSADDKEAVRRMRRLPKWAKPIWLRMSIRLMNGVPAAKAEALAWQEFAAAERANT